MPTFTQVGDLSRALVMRSAASRTKSDLMRLAREMSTGRLSDVPKALGGDTRRLASVQHRLDMIGTYRKASAEVEGRLDAVQRSLDGMQAVASGVGAALMSSTLLTDHQVQDARLSDARGKLDATLSLIGASFAGEYVLSGGRSTTPPLDDATDILASASTVADAETTLDAKIAAIDAFFDGDFGDGGFLDLHYHGSEAAAGDVPVGPETRIGNPVTAASPEVRATLKGLVIASLVGSGTLGTTSDERLQAIQAAGSRIMAGGDAMTRVQSRVGILQENLALAQTRNEAEESTLGIAMNGLVRADEYDTASAMAETQARLETLYAITARVSTLSLAQRL